VDSGRGASVVGWGEGGVSHREVTRRRRRRSRRMRAQEE